MSETDSFSGILLRCIDVQAIWNNRLPRTCQGFFFENLSVGNRSVLDQALASGLWTIDGTHLRIISVTPQPNDPQGISHKAVLAATPQLRIVPDPNVPGAIRQRQARTWAQQHGLNYTDRPPFGALNEAGLKGWILAPETQMSLILRST